MINEKIFQIICYKIFWTFHEHYQLFHRFGHRNGVSRTSRSKINSPQTWRAAPLSQYPRHPRTITTTITRPTIATHQTIYRQRTATDRVTTIHHTTILIACSRHRSTTITIRTQYSTIASRRYRRLKTRFMRHPLEQRLVSSLSLITFCFRIDLCKGWLVVVQKKNYRVLI